MGGTVPWRRSDDAAHLSTSITLLMASANNAGTHVSALDANERVDQGVCTPWAAAWPYRLHFSGVDTRMALHPPDAHDDQIISGKAVRIVLAHRAGDQRSDAGLLADVRTHEEGRPAEG
jgi:hypothetical protein